MADSTVAFNALEHLRQCLRCTICFCRLRDPHTLECGHTFCRGCLKRLAQVARADNPSVRRHRLHMACPSCRHQVSAKAALRGRISVDIVVKNILELWERECRLFLSSGLVKVKSACTQTGNERTDKGGQGEKHQNESEEKDKNEKGNRDDKLSSKVEQKGKQDKKEEDMKKPEKEKGDDKVMEKFRPNIAYFEKLMKRVVEIANEFQEMEREDKPPRQEPPEAPEAPAPTDPAAPGDARAPAEDPTQLSSSSSSTDASRDASSTYAATSTADPQGSTSEASLTDLVGFITLPRISFRREFTAVRLSFIVLWCLFSAYIVTLDDAGAPYAAPYVFIATLFMFLLCLG